MILSSHKLGICMGGFIVLSYGIYMFTIGGDGYILSGVIASLTGVSAGIGGYLRGKRR